MISIVNYGSGNISAIQNIYKRLNIDVEVVDNTESILNAEKLILPGVGSFDYNIKKLDNSGFRDTLNEAVLGQKTPILGICLGLQIMASRSEEGVCNGLGWINGRVRKFDINLLKLKPKIPHMGWNSIEVLKNKALFKDVDPDIGFYFVHSFYLEVDDHEDIMTITPYGHNFVSGINKDNIYATQFHPEKSHTNGIQLLKNFYYI